MAPCSTSPICDKGTWDKQRSLETEVLWKIPELNGSGDVSWGECRFHCNRLSGRWHSGNSTWQCSMPEKCLSLAAGRHHLVQCRGKPNFPLLDSAAAASTEIPPRLHGVGTQNTRGTALPAPDIAPSLAGGAKTSSRPCHWELMPQELCPSLAKVLQIRMQHINHQRAD